MGKLAKSIAHAGINSGAAVIARMVRVSDIKTDPELAQIFPVKEAVLLKVIESMKKNGYDKSQPIVTWKGKNTVVDGHTRLRAASEAQIPEIPVEEKDFESIEEAKLYVYKRQSERRNLTQAEIMDAVKNSKIKDTYDGAGRSAQQLGKMLNVSGTTVNRYRAVLNSGSDEIKEQIRQEELTISKGYDLLKGKQKNPELKKVSCIIHISNIGLGQSSNTIKDIFSEIFSILNSHKDKGNITQEFYQDVRILLEPITNEMFPIEHANTPLRLAETEKQERGDKDDQK
jgi:ParB family chromosome partitioning protein